LLRFFRGLPAADGATLFGLCVLYVRVCRLQCASRAACPPPRRHRLVGLPAAVGFRPGAMRRICGLPAAAVASFGSVCPSAGFDCGASNGARRWRFHLPPVLAD